LPVLLLLLFVTYFSKEWQSYGIIIYSNFLSNARIFINIGMRIIPLEATPVYDNRFYDLIHSNFSENWYLGPFSQFVFQTFRGTPDGFEGPHAIRGPPIWDVCCLVTMEHIVAYGLDVACRPKLSFMHKIGGVPNRTDSVCFSGLPTTKRWVFPAYYGFPVLQRGL